jgi:hypothetical protein
MKVKKVSIYFRLCDQPRRPFKRLKVRNPRQCGERDYYCLRVGGKFEFFAEHDAARKDLNEALHRKGEREHELRIGVAAPLIPQRTAAQPGKTPVADAVQKYFDNLAAMGKDEKSIRTYRYAINGFVRSYKKPYIEDYEPGLDRIYGLAQKAAPEGTQAREPRPHLFQQGQPRRDLPEGVRYPPRT